MSKATVGTFLSAMEEIGWKYADKAILGGPLYRFWDYKDRATDVWLYATHGTRPRIVINHRNHPYNAGYELAELELTTFEEKDSVMLSIGGEVLFNFYNYDKNDPLPDHTEGSTDKIYRDYHGFTDNDIIV